MQIFSSNRIEVLYERWKALVYDTAIDPFQRRFVIAPSPAMKTWLQLQLAKDVGVCFGMEMGSAEQITGKLQSALGGKEQKFFTSTMEFAWMLEAVLRWIIQQPWQNAPVWQPMLEYLHPTGPNLRKNEQHLLNFAAHLAELFLQYGQYALDMLDEWEKGHVEEWQAHLWCIFKKHFPAFLFPSQQLTLPPNAKSVPAMAVHIFAMSFLPPALQAFFQAISATVSVYYYLLSPCQMFWGDVCSDRQKRSLRTFWQDKGAEEAQIAELESFLNEHNALLANLGRMGREMSLALESCEAEFSDLYVLPDFVQNYARYQELLAGDIFLQPAACSMLLAVQADIALLCNPSAKIDLPATDQSIQMHCAPTKQREIEILYNLLVHLSLQEAISPSEIVVMAPDLTLYESAIAAVFGAEASTLNYQLMEMPSISKSALVRGFMHVLELGTGRWEMKAILNLLDYPEFQRKHNLSFADISQIRQWLKKSGIHWGQTSLHRQSALQRDYSQLPAEKQDSHFLGEIGTWEYGMGRLLMGMAVDPTPLKSLQFAFDLPLDEIESGQVELFAKWMQLVNQLKQDLAALSNGSLTLKEWSLYLQKIKDTHFAVDPKDKESATADQILTRHLQAIASKKLPKVCFSFFSIKQQLEKKLLEEKTTYREGDLHAVRFCSLLPMRALPAQIVVLIGMSESAFPRKDAPTSLNLMPRFKQDIYTPSQVDFDRYLFLEALLSARKHLIFSYVGYSAEEQRESRPSLLLRELFAYLDEGYTIDGKLPTQHCIKKHPFDAFHKSYFEKSCQTYLPQHYRMACAHYKMQKALPHRLISKFLGDPACQIEAKDELLALKDLESFAANPIKTYFNRQLQIYIDKPTSTPEELFELPPLEKFQLKRASLKMPCDEVLCLATRQGKLPTGLFKQIAEKSLESDMADMQRHLIQNGVEHITALTFSQQYTAATFSAEKGWCLPPLVLDVGKRRMTITGTLEDVARQGLIFHSDRNLKQLVKLWPKALLLLCAIEQHKLPIEAQLISSKHPLPIRLEQELPLAKLQAFVEYFMASSDALSLLLPEWVPAILKDKETLQDIIHAHITDEFTPFYNAYALWLFRNGSLNDFASTHWHELALQLYGELPTLLTL